MLCEMGPDRARSKRTESTGHAIVGVKGTMKHMNVVKFVVKPEYVDAYLESSRTLALFKGQISNRLIQTGDRHFCAMGLWESQEAMNAEMANMVAYLDTLRHMLEVISPELGVTDATSGALIHESS